MYSYQDYPSAYRKYNTQYPDAEVIGWVLYDTQTYTSGATTRLTFFNSVPVNTSLGNMETAGQLAPPKAFLVRAISAYFKVRPEAAVIDTDALPTVLTGCVYNLLQLTEYGVLQLEIGNKIYSEYPLWACCSGGGVTGVLSTIIHPTSEGDGLIDYGTLGEPDARNLLTLPKPLFIAPGINFQVVLTWPTALTLTRDIDICVALDGEMIRPVQ